MKTLTKDYLKTCCHITEVSKDGKVIKCDGKELKQFPHMTHHKFGQNKYYQSVTIYDFTETYRYMKTFTDKNGKKYRKEVKMQKKPAMYNVGRVVLAWYNGSITNDCDHKDNDAFNNSYDNLKEITRAANLAKRAESQRDITKRAYDLRKFYYEVILKADTEDERVAILTKYIQDNYKHDWSEGIKRYIVLLKEIKK